MNKSFAVLGLGKFGMSLAKALSDNGAEVLVADENEELVNQIADSVTCALTADLTDAAAIKGFGISNMDVVVVCMAQNLEASIMCVMVAKECGVKYVMAKASSERAGIILKKIGADEIIFPENETGIRMAKKLTSDNFLEFFEISDNLALVEMRPKDSWIGKSLKELNLRHDYNLNVVAVSIDHSTKGSIDPEKPIEKDQSLLIVIDKKDLKKIS